MSLSCGLSSRRAGEDVGLVTESDIVEKVVEEFQFQCAKAMPRAQEREQRVEYHLILIDAINVINGCEGQALRLAQELRPFN
jgi:hypothetical protein